MICLLERCSQKLEDEAALVTHVAGYSFVPRVVVQSGAEADDDACPACSRNKDLHRAPLYFNAAFGNLGV